MKTIVVLNPNCLDETTQAIMQAAQTFADCPVRITCITSQDGPPGIQTQEDADRSVPPLIALARQHASHADAVVIACFSDPGLHSLRELLHNPVFGIGESAMLTAMTQAQRIGVIAIAASSIPRHARYFRSMGIQERICAERSLDLSVKELSQAGQVYQRVLAVAKRLVDEDGADGLVMGCAGMTAFRSRLEDAVGVPVIEPTRAALTLAFGSILSDPAA